MPLIKIVEIDSCQDCPFFDNEYYMYAMTCVKLDRVMQYTPEGSYELPIPQDCPLETKAE